MNFPKPNKKKKFNYHNLTNWEQQLKDNDINKIMGIGIIRNHLAKDQTINVYDNPSFNNYIYRSSFYIPLIDTSCIDRENTKKRRKKTKYTYYENIQELWIEFIENELLKPLIQKVIDQMYPYFIGTGLLFMSMFVFIMIILLLNIKVYMCT